MPFVEKGTKREEKHQKDYFILYIHLVLGCLAIIGIVYQRRYPSTKPQNGLKVIKVNHSC